MQNIEKVYRENFNMVYKYLFCLTHNVDIAEELTQETFYIAVKYIKSFRGECKISVWLCQIAKNLWYKELKKKNKELGKEIINIEEIEEKETIEDKIVYNNERNELYKKIKGLDEKIRQVIYLRIRGELSFKEIGNIMNQTENWARTTFYRGKIKMKEGDENERTKRM